MYLIVDTETTGLPRSWAAPATDLRNWPRLVQIAWRLCAEDGGEIEAKDFIIKPAGFTVPAASSRIHGITHDRACRDGVPIAAVLAEFTTAISRSRALIAHNMSFDANVLAAELIRAGVEDALSGIKRICTKEIATDYCKIPGKYGRYKWPTLQELHIALFGRTFEETHDAAEDARLCANCFFELKRLGVIEAVIPSRA